MHGKVMASTKFNSSKKIENINSHCCQYGFSGLFSRVEFTEQHKRRL